MKTASDIIEKIGRPRIKAAMAVDDRAIRLHLQKGVLPSAWFDFCEKATHRRLPRHLFSFRPDQTT